jgi:hypothetical protein
MSTWTQNKGNIRNEHFRFDVAGAVTESLAERIVALLNAAEPGGAIDRVLGSIEGQCMDLDAWKALGALVAPSPK